MKSIIGNEALVIERYESLRLFALDRQQKHWKRDHTQFIRKGMSSWIAEETIKTPVEPKTNPGFSNANQKNDFQSDCEPQIMQTIADILFKKIKDNKCYC
jgi:hypothetical protein